jgi:hypothetical protein
MEASASRELDLGRDILIYTKNFGFRYNLVGKKKSAYKRVCLAWGGFTLSITVGPNLPAEGIGISAMFQKLAAYVLPLLLPASRRSQTEAISSAGSPLLAQTAATGQPELR